MFRLISVLFTALLLMAQQLSDVDRRILAHTFNNEFNESESLIDEQIRLHPNQPKYRFYNFAKTIIKIPMEANHLPSDKRRAHIDAKFKAEVEKMAEFLDKIDTDRASIDDKFYIGALYGYMGRFIAGESLFRAFKYGKKGRGLLEEVIEENPSYYDAYLGLGMFNYYADRLSGVIKFISAVLGFSGDRLEGLKQIKLAANKGEQASAEANFVLADIYRQLESNPEAAYPYIKRFIDKYPKNNAALNNYVNLLLEIDNYDELDKILQSDKTDVIRARYRSVYHFNTMNYKRSIEINHEIIKAGQEGSRSVRQARGDKAIALYLIGDHDAYNQTLKKISGKTRATLKDITADPNLLKLYEFRYHVMMNRDQAAIDKIIAERPRFKSLRLREMYYYYRAVNAFNQKKYNDVKHLLKSNFSIVTFVALKLKLRLFETIKPSEDELDDLIDAIDDNDFESLTYRAEDLVEKYDY